MTLQILNKTGERQIGRIQKKWGGDRTDNVNVDHEYFDVTCKLLFLYLVSYFYFFIFLVWFHVTLTLK